MTTNTNACPSCGEPMKLSANTPPDEETVVEQRCDACDVTAPRRGHLLRYCLDCGAGLEIVRAFGDKRVFFCATSGCRGVFVDVPVSDDDEDTPGPLRPAREEYVYPPSTGRKVGEQLVNQAIKIRDELEDDTSTHALVADLGRRWAEMPSVYIAAEVFLLVHPQEDTPEGDGLRETALALLAEIRQRADSQSGVPEDVRLTMELTSAD